MLSHHTVGSRELPRVSCIADKKLRRPYHLPEELQHRICRRKAAWDLWRVRRDAMRFSIHFKGGRTPHLMFRRIQPQPLIFFVRPCLCITHHQYGKQDRILLRNSSTSLTNLFHPLQFLSRHLCSHLLQPDFLRLPLPSLPQRRPLAKSPYHR